MLVRGCCWQAHCERLARPLRWAAAPAVLSPLPAEPIPGQGDDWPALLEHMNACGWEYKVRRLGQTAAGTSSSRHSRSGALLC